MNSYIALQSGGYYGERCISKGWIKEGQSFVVSYIQFIDYMNKDVITAPIFISDSYGVCIEASKALNESASHIEMKKYLSK